MVKCSKTKVSLPDLWVASHDKLSDFYASSWQRGDSPVPLLVIRIILTALSASIFVWSLVSGASGYWLIYLTNWGLVLVLLMNLSGLIVSCIAVCKSQPDVGDVPWYISVYWLFYNIGVVVAIMITALYWSLLYDPEISKESPKVFWLDVSTHAFNSCIAIAELVLSRTPVRMLHVYQPLGVGLWYAAFSGIYYAAGGTDSLGNPYIYEVLDWREAGQSAVLVTISAVGVVVLYTILWGLAFCRDKISLTFVRTTSQDLPPTPPLANEHTRIV